MESAKKKILIFLHKFPYPDNDSTKFRILNSLILPLNNNFNIEVLIVTYEKIKESDLDFLNKIVTLKFYIYPKWRFFLNILLNIFTFRPFQSEMFFFKNVYYDFLEKARDSDAIYIHTVRLGKYIEKLPQFLRKKIVLDYNDAISMHYLKGWMYYPNYLKPIILYEGLKLKFYEKKIFKILDNFTIVSEVDKNFILDHFNENDVKNKNFMLTYVSVKIEDESMLNETFNKDYLCFMGNLNYYPNFEGILHFVKDIWPFIKKEFKELEFLIIGKNEKFLKRKFMMVKGVKFLGYVDNPWPIIKNALAFVSPVRIGAGIQAKIIEVMGRGKIVISYPQGIEKVNKFENKKNILFCYSMDHQEWINNIKFVLKNKEGVEEIISSAKEIVLKEFNTERVAKAYFEIFNKILF